MVVGLDVGDSGLDEDDEEDELVEDDVLDELETVAEPEVVGDGVLESTTTGVAGGAVCVPQAASAAPSARTIPACRTRAACRARAVCRIPAMSCSPVLRPRPCAWSSQGWTPQEAIRLPPFEPSPKGDRAVTGAWPSGGGSASDRHRGQSTT